MSLRSSGLSLELRLDLQHDVVLVQLREHRRDLPLAEGVVERVVDHLRRDAEPRRGVAVDDERAPAARRSAGRWPRRAAPAACCSLSTSCGTQSPSSSASAIFQAVLILRAADAVFDRQVLHRLHEERDALDLGQLRLQPADDSLALIVALVERLEVDLDAAAVERRVGAVDADERRQALDRRDPCRITSASACWRSAIAANEIVCGASEMPRITPVSCTGKKPLGTTM